MRWRFPLVFVVIIISYLFLISNFFNIQIKNGNAYYDRAVAQRKASGILEPLRGNIYFTDKNNNLIPAALNKDYPVIFADPKKFWEGLFEENKKFNESVEELNQAIKISGPILERKLNKREDSYELIVQKADSEQIDNLKENNFKGIYIDQQKLRSYPFKNLASHVLGFVASANEAEMKKYGDVEMGRYGIELERNLSLAGQPGEEKDNKFIKAQNGSDVILTIDINIQTQAEEILKKLINDWQAEGGTAIVEEPKTGKILAMVNFPDFDPNEYSKSEIKNFMNPAVELVYEPGSVFKVITMAAGFDSGKITPDTTYIDTGSVILNGKKIENWDKKAYGKQTMTSVIEHSLNVGTVFAEKKIGHNIFKEYLIKFGLGKLTGVNLPGEVKGNINNLKKGKDIDFATASFGQGVSVTPLQLISAVSAIANGGVLMKPIISAEENPQIVARVISEESAQKVIKTMVSAVRLNKVADIPNYSIGGKTGTAFVPDLKRGGYSDQVINTYVGFASASDPRFIILIKLDKASGAPLAGQTVAPAFKELAQFIINYYNIAPDNL
ncbi:MAG: penicillin-binding protein 2 [Patescibacteria group bacterium]